MRVDGECRNETIRNSINILCGISDIKLNILSLNIESELISKK